MINFNLFISHVKNQPANARNIEADMLFHTYMPLCIGLD
jgi:hypothetical protein